MKIMDRESFSQRVYEPIRNRRVYDNTPGYKRYMKSTKELVDCVIKNRSYLTTTKGKYKRTRRAHLSIGKKARKVIEAMSYAEAANSTSLSARQLQLIQDPFVAESLALSLFIDDFTLTISAFYNSKNDNGFTVAISNGSYLAKKPFELTIRLAISPVDITPIIRVTYRMTKFPVRILSQTGGKYMQFKRNVGNVDSYPLFLESPEIEALVFDINDKQISGEACFPRNDIDLHIRNRLGKNKDLVDPSRIAMLRLQYA